jgi:hypothetical protein
MTKLPQKLVKTVVTAVGVAAATQCVKKLVAEAAAKTKKA